MLGAIAGDIIGSRFEGPTSNSSIPTATLPTTPCCTVAVADALLRDRSCGQPEVVRASGIRTMIMAGCSSASAYGS
jgi:hypothetical protein